MEFTIETTFKASATDIYTAWLNSEEHSVMTGGKAIASEETEFEFKAWDEYIQGRNLILEPNKRIVQSWRTTEFDDHEEDSQIEITLAENDGLTYLTLHHSNLPENGEHYKKGWDEHYFQPMKTYFECR